MNERTIELVHFGVDGRDVTGEAGGNAAMACRADGAPSAELIRQVLSRHGLRER